MWQKPVLFLITRETLQGQGENMRVAYFSTLVAQLTSQKDIPTLNLTIYNRKTFPKYPSCLTNLNSLCGRKTWIIVSNVVSSLPHCGIIGSKHMDFHMLAGLLVIWLGSSSSICLFRRKGAFNEWLGYVLLFESCGRNEITGCIKG